MNDFLEFPYRDIRDGIQAVLPHVGAGDKIFPGIFVTGEHLVATDRFTIGRWSHSEPTVSDLTILLPAHVAKWLIQQKVQGAKGQVESFRVQIETERISIIEPSGNVSAALFFAMETGPTRVESILRLIKYGTSNASCNKVRLNPLFVERFCLGAKKVGKDMVLEIELGDSSSVPARVTFGDQFVGLIQPMKMSD